MIDDLSRISAHDAVMMQNKCSELRVEHGVVYWVERLVDYDGRSAIVTFKDNVKTVMTLPEYNVKSSVQGYGGGSYCINDGDVYFVNFDDERIYRLDQKGNVSVVTSSCNRRYGDLIYDKARQCIICICEEDSSDSSPVKTSIVSINVNSGDVRVLVDGSDFYSSPRISSCGTQLAWISWSFPDMPWDSSVIQYGTINENNSVSLTCTIGNGEESIVEPYWLYDGRLVCLSDRGGFWNLYQCRSGDLTRWVRLDMEMGFPPYLLGLRTFEIVILDSSPTLIMSSYDRGTVQLAHLDLETHIMDKIQYPVKMIDSLAVENGKLYAIVSTSNSISDVVVIDIYTHLVRFISRNKFQYGHELIEPQKIKLDTKSTIIYAYFYQAINIKDEKPPLIVNIHGGPTGIAQAGLDPVIHFWLQRGYAYLDVNHRGSTGFGRHYRRLLNGNWGIYEVEDCEHFVKYLSDLELVDKERIVIRGHSAGGYTVLRSLICSDLFKAACCCYGVTSLDRLWNSTHKFESQYLYSLIGSYPDESQIYNKLSPINNIDKISTPVLFLQGEKDDIVPAFQTRTMAEKMSRSNVIAPYIEYEGEGHGFSRSRNKENALLSECYFYARILNISFDENINEEARKIIDTAIYKLSSKQLSECI